MTSRITPQTILDGIAEMRKTSKPRKFKESVDLQLNIKNYDTQKDKRFAGSLRLPNVCRPRLKVGIIADLVLEDQCKKLNLSTINLDDLKKLNKNKKLVKKLCAQYGAFLAADSVIRTIPRVVGPYMNRYGKFPLALAPGDDINARITDMRSTVKFQLKKVLCFGACVGHLEMTDEELRQNINMAINYLVSLLKKNWQNMRSVYLKSTMGKSQRLY